MIKLKIFNPVFLLLFSLSTSVFGQLPGDPVWFFPTGGPVVASPSIDNAGNIVFGSEDSIVYSLTPALGVNWAYKTGDLVTANTAISPQGAAVALSWDNYVYNLDLVGLANWTYNAGAFFSSSPAIAVNGTIYAGARDGILYALNPDGTVQWFHIANGPIQGSPAVGPYGTVYFGDESGVLTALNPDGSLKWEFQADIITGRSSRIRTTPAIDRSGIIYFGSGNHFFYALHPEDGSLKWKYETTDKNDSSGAIDENGSIVFGCRDGKLYKLDSKTGQLVWSKVVGDVFYCSPAIDTENNIYIAGFIGGGMSRLYAIDPDATTLWTRNYAALNDSSPVLSADGHLYIGFHDGNLYKIFTGKGPADSVWPMLARNARRTANIDQAFETAQVVGEWLGSSWFGWFSPRNDDWLYHSAHGWIRPYSEDPENFWFYDAGLQAWVWTARSVYPYLYINGDGWKWFNAGTYHPA